MNEHRIAEQTVNPHVFSIKELNELIVQHAPLVYFDPEEKHKPCTIESYLAKTNLINETENLNVQAEVNSLPIGLKHKGSYYLQLKDSFKNTENSLNRSPKVYVHAKPCAAQFTDLQFWFFFEQSGAMAASIKWKIDTITGHSSDFCLAPLGQKTGCWKRLTLRIINETRQLKEAFFSQPGNGIWIDSEKIEKSNNRIVVYLSRDSHFFYTAAGIHYSETLSLPVYSSTLEFSFKNINNKGEMLDCSSCYEIVSAEYLDHNKPIEPLWLNYSYPWGKEDASCLNQKSLKKLIGSAFGTKLEFLLSNSVTTELLGYLQTFFTRELQNGSLGPKNQECWNGEETDS